MKTKYEVQIGGNAATHDAKGNLTDYEINSKVYEVEYDLDNRVITVDVNNSDVEYRYDALGRRVIRKEGSDKYLLTTRPKLLLNDTETALFISGYGDRLSSGHLGNWMRKMLTKAEINRPGGCHLLRHTCATHMLEGGADIRYIQQMLGHSSLDTTSIYTQVAIHQLQQIYNTTHPSAKNKQDKPEKHC